MDSSVRKRKNSSTPIPQHAVLQSSTIYTQQQLRQLKIFIVFLLYITYGSYYLPRKADAIVKVPLQQDAHFSVEDLALGDTAYLFVYTFALFGSGVIGASVPSNIMLSVGLIGVAFSSFLKANATGPWMYAFAQALHAIFQSTGWPTCIKLLAVWITHGRGFIMGVWTTCQSLGGVLGALYATNIIASFEWPYAYYAHIPILLFVAFLNFVFIKDDMPLVMGPDGNPMQAEREDDNPAASKASASEKGTSNEENQSGIKVNDENQQQPATPTVSQIVQLPGVPSVGTAYFFLKFLRYALLFWLPYYYKQGLGYDKSTAGYISTSFEFGGLVGTPLIGYLSDQYLNKRRDLASGIFMTFAGFVLLLCIQFADQGPGVNAFLMTFVGIGIIGPDSVLSGTIAQDIGARSCMGKAAVGQIAGFVNSVGSFGSIFQSSATAYISSRYGWPTLFLVFVASAIVSAAILLRVSFVFCLDDSKK